MNPTVLSWDVDAVTTAFGLGHVVGSPEAVARGAMGWIWRFETTRGVWAVKHLFGTADAGAIEREVRFVTRAGAAGVAAPAVVRTAGGSVLALVPDIAGEQAFVRVYEWIESLRSPESPVGPDDAARAGEALAVMHTVGEASKDPPDDWYVRRFLDRTWASTIARSHRAGDPVADALGAALAVLNAAEASTGDVQGPWQVCHRDFDPENVLVDVADRFIVVDWEDAGPLRADAELGYTLLAWASRPDGEPDVETVRALLTGYASRRALPPPDGTDVFSVALITRLNYIDVLVDAALDDRADAAERARARSVAAFVLERLPTPQALVAVLDEWRDLAT